MQGKVSVGLSTVTGYGVSSAAFVGAVLAYLGGDHSNQTVAIIGLGIIGALAFAITNIGRQRQAIAITARKPAGVVKESFPVYVSAGLGTATTSEGYVAQSNAGPVSEGPGDPLPGELSDVASPDVVPADTGDGEAAPA